MKFSDKSLSKIPLEIWTKLERNPCCKEKYKNIEKQYFSQKNKQKTTTTKKRKQKKNEIKACRNNILNNVLSAKISFVKTD